MTLKKLDIPVQALYSTLGRTAARTLETKIFGTPCSAGTTSSWTISRPVT